LPIRINTSIILNALSLSITEKSKVSRRDCPPVFVCSLVTLPDKNPPAEGSRAKRPIAGLQLRAKYRFQHPGLLPNKNTAWQQTHAIYAPVQSFNATLSLKNLACMMQKKYGRLSFDERIEIEKLLSDKNSYANIATALSRSKSTIQRDVIKQGIKQLKQSV
jgi:hypothetical protein